MTAIIDNRIVQTAVSIASQYPVIKRVGIFGSYARGEQTTGSDIDILYDYYYNEQDTSYVLGILEFIEEMENAIKNSVGGDVESDYISFNGLMSSRNKMMRESILNDVIWVYNAS